MIERAKQIIKTIKDDFSAAKIIKEVSKRKSTNKKIRRDLKIYSATDISLVLNFPTLYSHHLTVLHKRLLSVQILSAMIV